MHQVNLAATTPDQQAKMPVLALEQEEVPSGCFFANIIIFCCYH
jgi:hypothetical protein